jgi:hypothetical protein
MEAQACFVTKCPTFLDEPGNQPGIPDPDVGSPGSMDTVTDTT